MSTEDTFNTQHPEDRFHIGPPPEAPNEIWIYLKKYINKLKIGEKFTRSKLIKVCYRSDVFFESHHSSNTTADLYRFYLTKIGILEYTTHNTYKKLANIPESVCLTEIRRILLDESMAPWKEWIIPLHEKLGVTEEELYKKGEE